MDTNTSNKLYSITYGNFSLLHVSVISNILNGIFSFPVVKMQKYSLYGEASKVCYQV